MVENRQNPNREEIGRKSGMGTTGGMQREGQQGGQKQGWSDFRTKVKSKWNQLSDRDLDQYQNRRRDDLVGFIGERVGGDRNAIERDVDNIARETNYRLE